MDRRGHVGTRISLLAAGVAAAITALALIAAGGSRADAASSFSASVTSGTAPLTIDFSPPSGDWTSCLWSFGDGSDASGACTPSHEFAQAGEFSVSGRVCDGTRCVFGSVSIAVEEQVTGELPVILDAGCNPSWVPAGALVGCAPRLSGGEPTSYRWTATGGSPTAAAGTLAVFTTRFETAGTARIALEVCNDAGCDSFQDRMLVLEEAATEAAAPSPIAICSPAPAAVGQLITCTMQHPAPDAPTFIWEAPDASPAVGAGYSFKTQFESWGIKTITLTACDWSGCGQVTSIFEVVEQPSISSLGCTPTLAPLGGDVTCTPLFSGSPPRARWSAPGATQHRGWELTFTTSFDTSGAQTIALRLCNDAGCDEKEITLWVQRR